MFLNYRGSQASEVYLMWLISAQSFIFATSVCIGPGRNGLSKFGHPIVYMNMSC